jgi:16S rRNA (cytosine967-C5)-methyltransferase
LLCVFGHFSEVFAFLFDLVPPAGSIAPMRRADQYAAAKAGPHVYARPDVPPEPSRVAARVIEKADRQNPADAVLRDELRSARALTPSLARQVSEMVFSFYRWRGWISQDKSLWLQINEALELGRRFSHDPGSFSDEELLQRAVPDWVPQQVPVTPEWLRSVQSEPSLWLRAKTGQGTVLAHALGHCSVPSLPDALLYAGREDLFQRPEFHAGAFEIQDVASQAVTILCNPAPGSTWWDACAGEGGKTLHLSALMQNKGMLWASDRAEWRLKKLRQRAARAGCFNYRLVSWNGSPKLPTKTRFDGVLVDAPCTGLGTWQRNPHARWTTSLKDVAELSALQQQLLKHAAPSLKPGGSLVYAVCTLTALETSTVVSAFEAEHPDFEPIPLLNPFQANALPAHPLWLWPQATHGNGMFVAAWQRKS